MSPGPSLVPGDGLVCPANSHFRRIPAQIENKEREMFKKLVVPVFVLGLATYGCSSDSTPNPGTGGTTGSAGKGGTTGSAGRGGTSGGGTGGAAAGTSGGGTGGAAAGTSGG